ncbi:hypothetical protein Pint_01757 [Pistacia integerrima]|uniref:Uncharacterized protein n=1 Tax=Pistacia integerrima TaxID=434235 RepID=A0ACC0ZMB6_9ROSI|nr:hypothetical protein Pint_01757 [Pistacia integerrima]
MRGFLEGCRHFIGIDGCHLKGHFGGVLLSAVSIDANSGIYPLALCICEIENNESLGFFLSLLRDFLGDVDPVIFMSDKQKDILNALEKHWPNARTRYCVRHVYANFIQKISGIHLRNLFWAMSKASNRVDFVAAMGKVFNAWLGDNKELPILSLLEMYRMRVMKRMQCRFQAGTDWVTPLPPVVHKKINRLTESVRCVEVVYCRSNEFEISGVPCVHAVSCLLHMNVKNFKEHVDEKLRILMYMQTYAYMIHHVPDKCTWLDVNDEKLWPPYKHAKSGRPAKARKRDPTEEPKNKRVSTHRCNFCNALEHNKRSCKDNPTTGHNVFKTMEL